LDGTRLLTLLGMGGAGKTRLALRLAEVRLGEFPDGVWFMDVAPLAEPDRVIESLAAVLGVRDEPGHTLLEGVLKSLAMKRALLIVDNAETHAESCAQLAGVVLAACRHLKIMITSRVPIGLEAEAPFTVPSPGVPGPIAA